MADGEFLKCPECDGEYFKEWTYEMCMHRGVKVEADGGICYDEAGYVEVTGDTLRVICYECEKCDTDFELKDGKLEKMPE